MPKKNDNVGELDENGLLHRSFTSIKSIDADKRTIDFIISTDSIDRYGDIIEVPGWDLKAYKKNPVVLFGHDSRTPPIGKANKVWKESNALMATAEFMPEDLSSFAHTIFRMYQEKFLNAVSVGFKPLQWERILDDDEEWTGGIRFKKQELLEFSAVPIPANPEALIGARSKGIDTNPIKEWLECKLDNWEKEGKVLTSIYDLDKKGFEIMRRRAAGVGRTFHVPPEKQDELLKKNLEAIRKAKAEKEKKKESIEVEAFDFKFDLPALTAADLKDAGEVVFSMEEIDGKEFINIDKADDTILIAQGVLIEDNKDFYNLTLEDKEGVCSAKLSFNATDKILNYELIGFEPESKVFLAMKLNELEIIEEKEESSESETETNEEEASTDTIVEELESEEESDVSEESSSDPIEPNAVSSDEEVDEASVDDDDDKEMTASQRLIAFELYLVDFEESFDKSPRDVSNRHIQRKSEYIAIYLREIADKLDGGKNADKTTVKGSNEVETQLDNSSKEKKVSVLSKEDVQEAVMAVAKRITPMLDSLVKEAVGKVKGRLD